MKMFRISTLSHSITTQQNFNYTISNVTPNSGSEKFKYSFHIILKVEKMIQTLVQKSSNIVFT